MRQEIIDYIENNDVAALRVAGTQYPGEFLELRYSPQFGVTTYLHLAVLKQRVEVVICLVEITNRKKIVDNLKKSPLDLAIFLFEKDKTEDLRKIVKFLQVAFSAQYLAEFILEREIDGAKAMLDRYPDLLNAKIDAEGNTPLHLAYSTKNKRILLAILSYPEIDLTRQNNAGKTLLDLMPVEEICPGKREKTPENIIKMFCENGDIFSVIFYFKISELIFILEKECLPSYTRFLEDISRKAQKIEFLKRVLIAYDQRENKQYTLTNLVFDALKSLNDVSGRTPSPIGLQCISHSEIMEKGFSNRTRDLLFLVIRHSIKYTLEIVGKLDLLAGNQMNEIEVYLQANHIVSFREFCRFLQQIPYPAASLQDRFFCIKKAIVESGHDKVLEADYALTFKNSSKIF